MNNYNTNTNTIWSPDSISYSRKIEIINDKYIHYIFDNTYWFTNITSFSEFSQFDFQFSSIYEKGVIENKI